MTFASRFDDLSTEELGSHASDFYKEVHGIRPRWLDFSNRQDCLDMIESLCHQIDDRASTREGRNDLRNEGWVINTPTPEEDGFMPWWKREELPEQQRSVEDQFEWDFYYAPMGYAGERYEHLTCLEF